MFSNQLNVSLGCISDQCRLSGPANSISKHRRFFSVSKSGLREKALLNANQLKAARGVSGITTQRLAELSGVGRSTIVRFESGGVSVGSKTAQKLLSAFDALGVQILTLDMVSHGEGAAMRPGAKIAGGE
jgi:DNA-binding XRE family transcriptional regulator